MAKVLEEESAKLFRIYAQDRDLETRNRLVDLHQGLVRPLANRFAYKGEPIEDLVQVGAIGLINAIERYDINRGTKFSTFATPTITGEIRRYFRDVARRIKVPRRMKNLASTINSIIQENGGSFNICDLAFKLDISEEKVCEALRVMKLAYIVSLDALAPISFEDFLDSGDRVIDDLIEYSNLAEAINSLQPREKFVIYHCFYDSWSQTEVGKNLGVSTTQISKIQAKALLELKDALSSARD